MNPKLNITATEETKATVGTDGKQGRSVLFKCGVVITRTLNDMGLEFTLDAPEDMSLHNELQAMSVEQRGKLAVTMLTTGMYLADGNTGGFSMNSALSSFLQSEINSITGNALRTLDLSFGIDNSTDASGNMHTDYSFKFAKRFWNNRLKIIVGGKYHRELKTPTRTSRSSITLPLSIVSATRQINTCVSSTTTTPMTGSKVPHRSSESAYMAKDYAALPPPAKKGKGDTAAAAAGQTAAAE